MPSGKAIPVAVVNELPLMAIGTNANELTYVPSAKKFSYPPPKITSLAAAPKIAQVLTPPMSKLLIPTKNDAGNLV